MSDKNKDKVLNFSEYEDLSLAFDEFFRENLLIQDPALPQIPDTNQYLPDPDPNSPIIVPISTNK